MANTQTVTVVFTDLVGSTALLSRVGEERAEELRREHFGILREVIARTGCREVKNLGDGLMIVVPSAGDGVACAVAIQQAFEHRNRDAAEPLLIRVGMSLGDADLDDGDYFGIPVVEASRLCAKAEGGDILVTDVIRVLSGSRGSFEFVSVGELELKGLDHLVAACRVTWQPLEIEKLMVPLPGRINSAVPSNFVGRTTEFEALDASLKAATAGATRTVLISGEPGIGKTTLSSSFARNAFESGMTVLYGRCDEDLGIPYQPWAEALTHVVTAAPDDLLKAHVEVRAGELARLVPELAHRVPLPPSSSLGDSESERYLLFGAVLDLLSRVSAMSPVVLLLDDLHWSDRQSVQLLRHVVSADAGLSLLVIGTFRESEVANEHPLAETLAALHREAGVERIALRGLGDDELLDLLEATAGHRMEEDGVALRNALMAETEGNPFFVGEMLRHLAETGAIYQDETRRWVASPDLQTSGLPVSIREVVGRRVARLGDQPQRVLSLAAVIGRDFDTDVLSRVAELDEDEVIDLCDQAVASGVLTESGRRYSFAHALIEHTLYDSLSTNRRARSHQKVADALEVLCGEDPGERIGELAYHWAHATQPRDAEKAIVYAQRAGDRALAQLAPDEALRWYRDALELLDRAPTDDLHRRATLLLGLGDAQRQTGDAAHRETLLAAARLADDIDAVDLLVRATLRNSRGWASSIGEIDHQRIELITRALDRLEDAETSDHARLLALLCSERTYDETDANERVALATRAVEMARRTGDEAALVEAIQMCHEGISRPRTLELRRQWTSEACETADKLADPIARVTANRVRLLAGLGAGDPVAIHEASSIFELESERIGQPLHHWYFAINQAVLHVLKGDLVAAEGAATKALTLGMAAGQPDALAYFGAQLTDVRAKQGRLHELLPLIEQAVQDNPGLPVFRAALVRAKIHADENDVSALLDAEVANDFPVFEDTQWLTAHTLWADAAARSKHRPAAAVLYQLLLPWHAQFSTTGITLSGSVAHFLGVLAHALDQLDEAHRWFAESLACHENLRAPYFIAFTQTAWAALLIDRNNPGDAQSARAFLEVAVPVAVESGYGYIAQDAQHLLERIE